LVQAAICSLPARRCLSVVAGGYGRVAFGMSFGGFRGVVLSVKSVGVGKAATSLTMRGQYYFVMN